MPETPEKVEVPAETLKGILERLDQVESASKDKDEQIELLRNAVSRYRLEEAEAKNKKAGLPRAALMVHEGKVVVSFRWTKKEYIYNPLNPNTVAGEDLRVVLRYLDGTESREMPYISYVRTLERTEVEKVGEAPGTDDKGNEFVYWKVRFVNPAFDPGKEMLIDPQFINP